eukprot:GFUD01022973.1.p1 GENE.GFUD01022973.1~~GFUD01022973.1.p1  ORF type:complete len:364 (+),score=83.36 GFUD01022973.1:28-1119(+)
MRKIIILLFPLIFITSVTGHGAMVKPSNWFDEGGQVGMKGGRQCDAEVDFGENGPFEYLDFETGKLVKTKFYIRKGSSCMWHNNQTFTPHPPTLDPSLRTYQDYVIPNTNKTVDYTARYPWRSPGSAKIVSPCGVGGGNPAGCPIGAKTTDCLGGGYSYGPKAEVLKLNNSVTSNWSIGGVAEVAWGLLANHGGGYSYRLCKVEDLDSLDTVSEECFQQMPLEFVGETQWIQYGDDIANRTEIKANRTTTGTFPAGSHWTKLPVPACLDPHKYGGGFFSPDTSCSYGTQFPEPAPGLHGYGSRYLAPGKTDFTWSIVDLVRVPEDIQPGYYVLSFRWDCEQTPQVWNTCANLQLVVKNRNQLQ